MAVYAAYRHIELDNIGYGKKRVLKPPGGGSSDIFGVDPSEPRRIRNTNHLQSSVFGDAMETATPKSKNTDSYSRIFGNVAQPSVAQVVNSTPQKSNLGHSYFDTRSKTHEVTGETVVPQSNEDGENVKEEVDASEAREISRRNPINHVGMTEADCSQSYYNHRQRAPQIAGGNPVTGEGYAIANGVKEMAAAPAAAPAPVTVNGDAKTNGRVAASPPPPSSAPANNRGRVPPGGFSSGLW